jgi:CubicO group peptidase (beta-lactamase class C family)
MNSDAPFPRSFWQQMATPVRLNNGSTHEYGFGLQLYDHDGLRIEGHGGSFRPGYTSLLLRYPSKDVAFVSLSNYWGDGSPHVPLARAILRVVDPSLSLPDPPKPTTGR